MDPSESSVTTTEVAREAATDVAGLVEALRDPVPELILDVRTPREFRRGHVPGAVNLPMSALPNHLGDLEPHRAQTIYVICESGHRSARAAGMLGELGFDAVDVLGGTGAWRRSGLPIE
ncbi:MAG: rhodanese-like domain-containing protein [Deltaproteobacteria bacterium]|nr:rhodanese-like domain-containing protein [Deltaproteobacteria bacterium]